MSMQVPSPDEMRATIARAIQGLARRAPAPMVAGRCNRAHPTLNLRCGLLAGHRGDHIAKASPKNRHWSNRS